MNLTNEQKQILSQPGNLCINAVAGSGKTSTLIAYAASRPPHARILYLAFNKAIKLEAASRFLQNNLHNVSVETAHSLAFKHIVIRSRYRVRNQSISPTEIIEKLQLNTMVDPSHEMVIASFINKYLSVFCNSKISEIDEVDFLSTIADASAKSLAAKYLDTIRHGVHEIWQSMDQGNMEITHDFYLKKFQLQAPALPYDYILFDEGQDASAAMLDIFLKQKAVKVIVGDVHQQIYSWRYAVNSVEQNEFPQMQLSSSFRFRDEIAHLAYETIMLKRHLNLSITFKISGEGSGNQMKLKAVIARTNLGLLVQAIEQLNCPRPIKSLYFEGNFNAYTFADDGTSLYDVMNLHLQQFNRIRDPLIRKMKNLQELRSYAEQTENQQLKMMADIVKKYGKDLPGLIRRIRDRHVIDAERHKAEMFFSTVHRCKGMEYDVVHLAPDFITERKIKRAMNDPESKPDIAKLNEEINLLYVAITRTRNLLYIPDIMVPEGYAGSERIRIIRTEPEIPDWMPDVMPEIRSLRGKPHTPPKRKMKWDAAADQQLLDLYLSGKTIFRIATMLEISEGAVRSRLKKTVGTTDRSVLRQIFSQ
jgi:F-box protein, helicase, 18